MVYWAHGYGARAVIHRGEVMVRYRNISAHGGSIDYSNGGLAAPCAPTSRVVSATQRSGCSVRLAAASCCPTASARIRIRRVVIVEHPQAHHSKLVRVTAHMRAPSVRSTYRTAEE